MTEPDNIIRFLRIKEPYGCFSNFAPYPIKMDGKLWPTTEHYYQAQKYSDKKIQKRIREAKSPMMAANIGRDKSLPIRKNWEEDKICIMFRAVLKKVDTHKEVRDTLLSTKNMEIREHTSRDKFWGDGGDGSGKNILGKIFMAIRDNIRHLDKLSLLNIPINDYEINRMLIRYMDDDDAGSIKGISIGDGDYRDTISIVVNDGETYWSEDLTVHEAQILVSRINNKIESILNSKSTR